MDLIETAGVMQSEAEAARRAGQRLALVPTMGALHAGHLALVRRAKAEADHVTVSIFVNPTQFGPGEDLGAYPRDLDGDLSTLEALGGVDAVFAPSAGEMYPFGEPQTWVEVERLTSTLCGRYRAGHFRGVATVVAKLFHLCRPHVGVFGQKDAQQLVVLRRMARELRFGIEIAGVPIEREADGLACSSRNAYLTDEERAEAPVLSEAVAAARQLIEAGGAGGNADASAVAEQMREVLDTAPHAQVQYAEVVDARTLQPVEVLQSGQRVLAAVAVFFGETRLIDNVFATVGSSETGGSEAARPAAAEPSAAQ